MSTTVCLAGEDPSLQPITKILTDFEKSIKEEKEQAIALFRYTNVMNALGFKTPDKFSFNNGVYESRYWNDLVFVKPTTNPKEFEVYRLVEGNTAISMPNAQVDNENNLNIPKPQLDSENNWTIRKESTPSSNPKIDFGDKQLQHFFDPNSIYTKERPNWNKFGPMAAVVYLEASLPGNTATTLTGTVAHSAIFSTARTIAIKHSLLNYAPDKMDVLQGGIVAALATAAGVFDRSQCAQQLIKNIEASKVGQATIAKLNPRTKNLLISSCRLVRNACIYLIVDAAMRTYGYDVVLKNYEAPKTKAADSGTSSTSAGTN